VLGYVHPQTLLMLVHLSRQFRDLLTKQSSCIVWISSINHAGIPTCPVNLADHLRFLGLSTYVFSEFSFLMLPQSLSPPPSTATVFPTMYIGYGTSTAAVAAIPQGNLSFLLNV
jgi:hypothetical protein